MSTSFFDLSIMVASGVSKMVGSEGDAAFRLCQVVGPHLATPATDMHLARLYTPLRTLRLSHGVQASTVSTTPCSSFIGAVCKSLRIHRVRIGMVGESGSSRLMAQLVEPGSRRKPGSRTSGNTDPKAPILHSKTGAKFLRTTGD